MIFGLDILHGGSFGS